MKPKAKGFKLNAALSSHVAAWAGAGLSLRVYRTDLGLPGNRAGEASPSRIGLGFPADPTRRTPRSSLAEWSTARPSRAEPGQGFQRWDLHRAPCLSSGCCKKIPWPGWLAKSQKGVLRVPKNGKSKLKAPEDSMGSARLLPVHRWPRFAVPCFISGSRSARRSRGHRPSQADVAGRARSGTLLSGFRSSVEYVAENKVGTEWLKI